MKHILVCLTLICTLALAFSCALAAPAAQYPYQPMDSERIVFSLPEGLSARVTKSDGQINVLVDSAKTDWDKLVTHVDSVNTITMRLSSKAPNDGIAQYHQINVRNGLTPHGGTMLEQAFTEFDVIVSSEFANRHPADIPNLQHGNTWELAGFDAESSSILPYPTDNSYYVAYLIVWDPMGSSPIYEYYFVNISFTDDSARKVTMSNVPQSRLFPYSDNGMKTVAEAGALRYEIPLGHALCDNHIYTYVKAPAGAKSWKLAGDDKLMPLRTFEINGKTVEGLDISYYVRDFAFAQTDVASIFWFSDTQGENLLSFERLSLDIIVGNPDPFPRYIDDLTAVPKNRVRPMMWTGRELAASVDGISSTYAANQADYDTLRLSVDPQRIPADIRLDDLMLETFIQVPENAVAYSREQRSRDTIHGEMPDYYEQFEKALVLPSRREEIDSSVDLETFDGKKYIYISSMTVSESKPFEHDRELYLYTEGENSSKFAGRVTVIFWYDSLDPAAEPIKKEYIIRKMDPFTLETKSRAYTDQSRLPDKLTLPVIILSKGEEITDLYLVIEKMPTSDPEQIYYDLYVVDADGNEHKLGGDAIVIIPYPDERLGPNAPYSFKLAHYHNGKKLEYTEENGLLWREEQGLAFKTKDFSPFILSWESLDDSSVGTDPSGVETLPQTGDASMPLAFLMMMLAVSLIGLHMLSKRRV